MPLFPNRIPATKRLSAVCFLVVFNRSRQFSSTNILKDIAQNSSMLLAFKHCFHQISKHNYQFEQRHTRNQSKRSIVLIQLDPWPWYRIQILWLGLHHRYHSLAVYTLRCGSKFNLNQRKSLSELLRWHVVSGKCLWNRFYNFSILFGKHRLASLVVKWKISASHNTRVVHNLIRMQISF